MLVIGDQGTSQFVYHFIGQGEKIIIGVHLKPRYWLLVIGDQYKSVCKSCLGES